MFMSIVKAKVNGVNILENQIDYMNILKEFSKKLKKLTIDENKLFQKPQWLSEILEKSGYEIFDKQKEFQINSWFDLEKFLFAQYAYYHHTKEKKTTFKIDDDNYLELVFS